MSAYNLARDSINSAFEMATADGIEPTDMAHALLVSLIESYKALRGSEDVRQALEFQLNNLSDDLDYEFMRP